MSGFPWTEYSAERQPFMIFKIKDSNFVGKPYETRLLGLEGRLWVRCWGALPLSLIPNSTNKHIYSYGQFIPQRERDCQVRLSVNKHETFIFSRIFVVIFHFEFCMTSFRSVFRFFEDVLT